MRRRWRKILFFCLLPFLLVALWLTIERVRGYVSLKSYQHELISKGETLDVHQLLAPPIADADNGASEISHLATLLHEAVVLPTYAPARMRIVAPGKAALGFRRDFWVEDGKTNTWPELA